MSRSVFPSTGRWFPVIRVLLLAGLVASGMSCGTPRAEPIAAPWHVPIRELLTEHVESGKVAGAVALVWHRGEMAYLDAVGWKDIDDREPMRTDTVFRIASMTKPVTSVAVMMLRDEGRLRLDDPVSAFIPEFGDVRMIASRDPSSTGIVGTPRPVTILDLLTHTSGISYGFSAGDVLRAHYDRSKPSDGLVETPWSTAENARRIAAIPLMHAPGEQWTYGLSVDVLGRVVEVASGQSLGEFFEERIFGPLGMKDTRFFIDEDLHARLASLYEPAPGGEGLVEVGEEVVRRGQLVYSSTFHHQGPRSYFSGGAGLVSTARDYARFLRMLLGRGEVDGVRLLSPGTVDEMTSNRIGDLEILFKIHGDKFGLGFGVLSAAVKEATGAPESAGSYSWGGIFHTYFWVDPRQELIGLVLTQLYPFGHLSLWADFKSVVYASFPRD